MAANFDPYDRNSWYFGSYTRQEAIEALDKEDEIGVFLVRNSSTSIGDLVLCVREDTRVSHYIINKCLQANQTRYKMGDQMFADIPSLLSFYRINTLDTTRLRRPANKPFLKAKFDFAGSDQEDLPFRRGEILTLISKDEEGWWTAKNRSGETGSIPANYVEKIDSSLTALEWNSTNDITTATDDHNSASHHPPVCQYNTPQIQRKLPALARVTQARVPNAYDRSALKLEVGDIVKVHKINLDGQWEGEIDGKYGIFPFNHVEFIETETNDAS